MNADNGFKYLEMKNNFFYQVVDKLLETGHDYYVVMWVEDMEDIDVDRRHTNNGGYYDLVSLAFEDEGGYDRFLTIPYPLIDDDILMALVDNCQDVIFRSRDDYILNNNDFIFEDRDDGDE